MRPRSTEAPIQWAEQVEVVPVRGGRLSDLERTSADRCWGFDRGELIRLRSYFRTEGRDPTDVELAGLAQSWSEHCSYKSSRPILKAGFGPLRPKNRVLGTGDAGVHRSAMGRPRGAAVERPPLLNASSRPTSALSATA